MIALMQREGRLNRDLRRELAAKAKSSGDPRDWAGSKLSTSEMRLLGWYLDAPTMFSAFWGVVGVHRSKGPPKPQVFALAVDLVLLNAYDPSWQNEELDRDTLRVPGMAGHREVDTRST